MQSLGNPIRTEKEEENVFLGNFHSFSLPGRLSKALRAHSPGAEAVPRPHWARTETFPPLHTPALRKAMSPTLDSSGCAITHSPDRTHGEGCWCRLHSRSFLLLGRGSPWVGQCWDLDPGKGFGWPQLWGTALGAVHAQRGCGYSYNRHPR